MGGGGGGGIGGDRAETTATATANSTMAGSRATDDTAIDIPPSQPPALQVIVLGSGGGPLESNVTAFLVRSLASGWSKGSVVAVDAGVHLSAIAKILENTQPPALGQSDNLCLPHTLASGPFAGLEVPNATPTANAAHIHRSLIDTYLITHPHLDHISGFVVNTAGLPGSRPKRLAGLPSTIAAFKTHIFNNVIWPNLSDENNGAGLVTYMRLVEGGSPALGEGEGRGYLEICDGLAVKIWGVSHGHCIERHSHRGSGSSARHGSFDASTMGPIGVGMGLVAGNPPLMSPRALAHHNSANTSLTSFLQQQQQQREQDRLMQGGGGGSQCGTAAVGGRSGSISGAAPGESVCVYDSSAYFIRDVATGREVLIFGDVEPDSISLSPRNQQIWQEAAPKIATGKLAAIFIECSYDDSQSVDRLFGHLTPRFIVEEMSVLAAEVTAARSAIRQEKHVSASMDRSHSTGYSTDKKKRKRDSIDDQLLLSRRKAATPTSHGGRNTTPSRTSTTSHPAHLTPHTSSHCEDPVSPKTVKPPSYITQKRSISGNNMTGSSHGPSNLSEDALSASSTGLNLGALSTGGGGAMASVMNKGRSGSGSGSGSGSYFADSPHLATPTAELSLKDIEEMTNANPAAGAAVAQSLSNSGILPPPIMPSGGYRHEPQSIGNVDGLHENPQPHHHGSGGGSYAVGPLDHGHHAHGVDPSGGGDYDVSMGIAPDDVDTKDAAPTPVQRNGNHNHHSHHHVHYPHPQGNHHNHRGSHAHGGGVFDSHKEETEAHHEQEDKDTQLRPLRGLKVVIIHVKDKLNDGPRTEDVILEELLEHERELQLGCEFLVSEAGQDLYL